MLTQSPGQGMYLVFDTCTGQHVCTVCFEGFLHAATGWWGKTCRSLKCLCNFIRLIQRTKCKPINTNVFTHCLCTTTLYITYWTGRYLIIQNKKHTAKSKNKKRTRPSQQTSQAPNNSGVSYVARARKKHN